MKFTSKLNLLMNQVVTRTNDYIQTRLIVINTIIQTSDCDLSIDAVIPGLWDNTGELLGSVAAMSYLSHACQIPSVLACQLYIAAELFQKSWAVSTTVDEFLDNFKPASTSIGNAYHLINDVLRAS